MNEEETTMGQPAAKQGDQIVAMDTHIVMVPTPSARYRSPCRTRSPESSAGN